MSIPLGGSGSSGNAGSVGSGNNYGYVMPPGSTGSGGSGNQTVAPGSTNQGPQKTTDPAMSTGGNAYVWSDSVLQIGPISTGIHTRVLKDIAVMIAALAFLVMGVLLMAKPDINAAIKTAANAAKDALPVAAA